MVTDGVVVDPVLAEPAPPEEAQEPARSSLSPSRAADFKTCPLLYRFRTIDRLPEQPSPDQVRGTLVHAVLERLFDLPAEQRTVEQAGALVEPQWQRLLEEQEHLADLFTDGGTPEEFLTSARGLLDGYFAVEDPRRLDPAERECLVTTEVDEGRLLLRGYIDRLDVSPAGDLRVVDYKTGGAPREAFEARARFERKLVALWAAIERATEARDFRPKPSRLCAWCAHQALCPAFDGTPPPFPERVPAAELAVADE